MGHANRHNMLSELNGAKKTTQSQNEHIQMKKKTHLTPLRYVVPLPLTRHNVNISKVVVSKGIM